MLTRRDALRLSGMMAASAALPFGGRALQSADYRIEIAPYSLEVARMVTGFKGCTTKATRA